MLSKIKRFLSVNWRPKFFCLLLAIVLWLAVKHGGVDREQKNSREQGDIILATP